MSWDFDAGNMALNFVNTLEWRRGEDPQETFNSLSDLIEWAQAGKLLSKSEVECLSSNLPKDSQSTLDQVKEMREGLYRIFSSIAAGSSPDEDALELLNNMYLSKISHSKLEWEKDKLAWVWSVDGNIIDRILWLVSQYAVDLLMDDMLDRLGECADDRGCAYMFIDMTRNHSRKWCSMESCGNRAKARKHYQRSKKVKGVN